MTERAHAPDVQWPAILKLHGAVELIPLLNPERWGCDPHLQAMQMTADDCLIDSSGRSFRIGPGGTFIASGHRFGLSEVLQLVRMHAAQDGACCVAKLNARSIADAIAMIQE
jgi:hypothetical protein